MLVLADLLATIFPEAKVKLDPFHAIQRTTKEIPKKKGTNEQLRLLRKEMMKCLKLIIRQPADSGDERTMTTASPLVIEKNIQMFLEQWEPVMVEQKPVLPKTASESLSKLLVHVRNGCLSDIPPSFGTSRNEGIHKVVAKWFRGKKVGLQLALSHLGTFFYRLVNFIGFLI